MADWRGKERERGVISMRGVNACLLYTPSVWLSVLCLSWKSDPTVKDLWGWNDHIAATMTRQAWDKHNMKSSCGLGIQQSLAQVCTCVKIGMQ